MSGRIRCNNKNQIENQSNLLMFIDEKSQIEIHAVLGEEVSSGTLHGYDLAIRTLDVIKDTPEYVALMASNFLPSYARENRDSVYWDTDKASALLEELHYILESYAPEGYYFGNPHDDQPDTFGFYKYGTE